MNKTTLCEIVSITWPCHSAKSEVKEQKISDMLATICKDD